MTLSDSFELFQQKRVPYLCRFGGRENVRTTIGVSQRNVSSHLRKPDGTEYPVLPLLTNDCGEFTHDIETLVLTIGTHELWIVDDTSKTSSN